MPFGSFVNFFKLNQGNLPKAPVIFIFESHDSKGGFNALQDNLDFLVSMQYKAFGVEGYLNTTAEKFCNNYEALAKTALQIISTNSANNQNSNQTDPADLISQLKSKAPWYKPGRGHEEAIQIKSDFFSKLANNKECSFFQFDIVRDLKSTLERSIAIENGMADNIHKARQQYGNIVVSVGAGHAKKLIVALKERDPSFYSINFFFLAKDAQNDMNAIGSFPTNAYLFIDQNKLAQNQVSSVFNEIIIKEMNRLNLQYSYFASYQQNIESSNTAIVEADKIIGQQGTLTRDFIGEIEKLICMFGTPENNQISLLKSKLSTFLELLQDDYYTPMQYSTIQENFAFNEDNLIAWHDLRRELMKSNLPELSRIKALFAEFQREVNMLALSLFDNALQSSVKLNNDAESLYKRYRP